MNYLNNRGLQLKIPTDIEILHAKSQKKPVIKLNKQKHDIEWRDNKPKLNIIEWNQMLFDELSN